MGRERDGYRLAPWVQHRSKRKQYNRKALRRL